MYELVRNGDFSFLLTLIFIVFISVFIFKLLIFYCYSKIALNSYFKIKKQLLEREVELQKLRNHEVELHISKD